MTTTPVSFFGSGSETGSEPISRWDVPYGSKGCKMSPVPSPAMSPPSSPRPPLRRMGNFDPADLAALETEENSEKPSGGFAPESQVVVQSNWKPPSQALLEAFFDVKDSPGPGQGCQTQASATQSQSQKFSPEKKKVNVISNYFQKKKDKEPVIGTILTKISDYFPKSLNVEPHKRPGFIRFKRRRNLSGAALLRFVGS